MWCNKQFDQYVSNNSRYYYNYPYANYSNNDRRKYHNHYYHSNINNQDYWLLKKDAIEKGQKANNSNKLDDINLTIQAFKKIGDWESVAYWSGKRAEVLPSLSNLNKAIQGYRYVDNWQSVAYWVGEKATAYPSLSRMNQAITAYRNIRNLSSVAYWAGKRARAYPNRSHMTQAIQAHQQVKNWESVAYFSAKKAKAYPTLANINAAIQVYKDLNNWKFVAHFSAQRAELYSSPFHIDQAIQAYIKLNDQPSVAYWSGKKAEAWPTLENLDHAIQAYEKRKNWVSVALFSGKRATDYPSLLSLNHAIQIHKGLKNWESVAYFSGEKAKAYPSLANINVAIQRYRDVENLPSIAYWLGKKAQILPTVENINAAIQAYRVVENWQSVVQMLELRAKVYGEESDFHEAIEAYEQLEDWVSVAYLSGQRAEAYPTVANINYAIQAYQYVKNYISLASMLALKAEVSRELADINKARKAFERLGNMASVAYMMELQAIVSDNRDDFDRAINIYQKLGNLMSAAYMSGLKAESTLELKDIQQTIAMYQLLKNKKSVAYMKLLEAEVIGNLLMIQASINYCQSILEQSGSKLYHQYKHAIVVKDIKNIDEALIKYKEVNNKLEQKFFYLAKYQLITESMGVIIDSYIKKTMRLLVTLLNVLQNMKDCKIIDQYSLYLVGTQILLSLFAPTEDVDVNLFVATNDCNQYDFIHQLLAFFKQYHVCSFKRRNGGHAIEITWANLPYYRTLDITLYVNNMENKSDIIHKFSYPTNWYLCVEILWDQYNDNILLGKDIRFDSSILAFVVNQGTLPLQVALPESNINYIYLAYLLKLMLLKQPLASCKLALDAIEQWAHEYVVDDIKITIDTKLIAVLQQVIRCDQDTLHKAIIYAFHQNCHLFAKKENISITHRLFHMILTNQGIFAQLNNKYYLNPISPNAMSGLMLITELALQYQINPNVFQKTIITPYLHYVPPQNFQYEKYFYFHDMFLKMNRFIYQPQYHWQSDLILIVDDMNMDRLIDLKALAYRYQTQGFLDAAIDEYLKIVHYLNQSNSYMSLLMDVLKNMWQCFCRIYVSNQPLLSLIDQQLTIIYITTCIKMITDPKYQKYSNIGKYRDFFYFIWWGKCHHLAKYVNIPGDQQFYQFWLEYCNKRINKLSSNDKIANNFNHSQMGYNVSNHLQQIGLFRWRKFDATIAPTDDHIGSELFAVTG